MSSQETSVDVRQALRVFDKIQRFGQQRENEKQLFGVFASTDFDGYTVTLRDANVRLDVLFHNRFNIDYKNKHFLKEFLSSLAKIDHAELSKESL